jgi:hypothetical protein
MKQRIIAAGALLLIAGAGQALAQGGRWVTVGDAAGGPIEVDRGSLNWHRMQHALWRIRYAVPQPNGAVEERNIELIDCHARTSAPISTRWFGADGRIINEQTDPISVAQAHLKEPTISSPGKAAAAGACRLRPPPPKKKRVARG